MLKPDRFRRWFGYSRRERQGTYILSLILVVVLIARMSGLIHPGSFPLAEVIYDSDEKATASLFLFDPNSAGIDDLILLGLSQRQATTLDNYRKAGGRFRKPEDFRKVYGIDSSLQERLIPYINIGVSVSEDKDGNNMNGGSRGGGESNMNGGGRRRGDSNGNSGRSRIEDAATDFGSVAPVRTVVSGRRGENEITVSRNKSGSRDYSDRNYGNRDYDNQDYRDRYPLQNGAYGNNPLIIELNSADSFLLKSLPGIGNVLSSRIVRYRNLLGGFVTVNQMEEVYGIDSLLAAGLEPLLFTDTTLVRPMDINRADYGDLLRHPYISEIEASLIIHYRKTVGVIESISELLVNRIIEPARFWRVYPYLTVTNDSILIPA